MVAKSRF